MIRRALKARTSHGLRLALRLLADEVTVHRRHRAGVRHAKALGRTSPLRLNLGSGMRPRRGWINVDLGDSADLTLDLRRPLPFRDRTADEIYTEHFVEHLAYTGPHDLETWEPEVPAGPSEALDFLRECARVLKPGGLLDVVVPDAECIIQEYASRHDQPFPKHAWWGPAWCDAPLHCVNYVFRQGREHRYAYDGETLTRVLRQAGFAQVVRRTFDPEVDAPNHAIASLCLHARTPASFSSEDADAAVAM